MSSHPRATPGGPPPRDDGDDDVVVIPGRAAPGDGGGGGRPGDPARRPPAWAVLAVGLVAGVALGIVLAGAFYLDFRTFFLHPELIGNLESFATIVALGVGAWWGYSRFLRTREAAPHLEVSQTLEHLFLGSGKLLLRVNVTVENRGKVLVPFSRLSASVDHVHPLKDGVLTGLVDLQTKREAARVPWKRLAARTLRPAGDWRLEPGEKVRDSFDFVLDHRLRAVAVYTFVPHDGGEGGGPRYGWGCRTLYRIEAPKAAPKPAAHGDIYAVVDLSRYLPSAEEER